MTTYTDAERLSVARAEAAQRERTRILVALQEAVRADPQQRRPLKDALEIIKDLGN